jgi:hypothetical protein
MANLKSNALVRLSFLLVVIIIIGIVLAVYFGRKKTQETETNNEGLFINLGPQIDYNGFTVQFNPTQKNASNKSAERYTIEGYTTEWLTGDDDSGDADVPTFAEEGDIDYVGLSKNVKVKVSWYNQGGFNIVNKLIVRHLVDDEVKDTKEFLRTNTNESAYFQSFTENDPLTYTFGGEDITYSVVGENKVTIHYVADLSTSADESEDEIELTPSTLEGYTITTDALAQTLEMAAPIEVVWDPSTSDDITINPVISRKGYYIYPGNANLSFQEYAVEDVGHGQVYLVPSGDKNTTVKLKLATENKFLKYDIDDTGTFLLDETDGTEFTLVKGETSGTIRFKVGDKYAAIVENQMLMLETDAIATRSIYKTLDNLITETPKKDQDCVAAWTPIDNTLDKDAATEEQEYLITTYSGGSGTKCETTHGKTRTLEGIDIPCEGEYDDTQWTPCTAACGGGTQKKPWVTFVTSKNNGTACPAGEDLYEKRDCNTFVCPVNCKGGWTDWTICDNPCGSGKTRRTFNVEQEAKGTGTPCPTIKNQEKSCTSYRSCYNVAAGGGGGR